MKMDVTYDRICLNIIVKFSKIDIQNFKISFLRESTFQCYVIVLSFL